MWKFLKVSASIIAILFVGMLSYFYYLDFIGPALFGPKSDVDAICNAIEPGMTMAQIVESRAMTLEDLNIQNTSGPDMSMISATQLQVEIHHHGGYMCICQVDIDAEDDVAISEGRVFCVD